MDRETDLDDISQTELPQPSFLPDFLGGNSDDIPSHVGSVKQLYSRTGFNLSITEEGRVFGTNEAFNVYAILEVSSPNFGEVQIKGMKSQLYVAMDDNGSLYGQMDPSSEDTVFLERYSQGYNRYLSKKHAEKGWYLALKKSGKPKKGEKTAFHQKAVQFIPRPAFPDKP